MSAIHQKMPKGGLEQLFSEAVSHWNRGNYSRVIELLQHAHKLKPSEAAILLDLGRTHATIYNFSEAERSFAMALRLLPGQSEVLVIIGQHWLGVRNYEAAKKVFEKVLQQREIPIQTYLRLAEIYERHGRQTDANDMLDRASRINSSYPPVAYLRAKFYRQAKQLERAEEILRALVADPECDLATRQAAWHELATVLDSQKRFDDAMSAFCESKTLLAREATSAIARLKSKQAMIEQTKKDLTETLLQRWRSFGQTQLQPARKLALLCGHARSGTTLLEYVLDAHPQIISADETSVFANLTSFPLGRGNPKPPPTLSLLDSMNARTLRQLRSDYVRGTDSFLGQAIGDRLLIDKNPALTFDIPVFLRIFPETKFIVALRDPRDVCLSCFMQFAPIVTDSASWLSIGETVRNYASIMGFWLAMKPHLPNCSIEVRYEELVENLELQARVVIDFLELNWDERLLRFNEHTQNKTVCSPTYKEVTRPVYKNAVGRWRNYEKYFEPHLEKLEPFIRTFGYT